MGRPALQLSTEIVDLLGKVPDGQLARMARCSMTAIINRRNKLGIKPYDPRTALVVAKAPAPASAPVAAAPTTPAPRAAATVAEKSLTTLQSIVSVAKATPEGMVIPYDLFARAAQEAWR